MEHIDFDKIVMEIRQDVDGTLPGFLPAAAPRHDSSKGHVAGWWVAMSLETLVSKLPVPKQSQLPGLLVPQLQDNFTEPRTSRGKK